MMPRPCPLRMAGFLLLAACATPAPETPDRAGQERACAAIVGAHVGMSADTVPVEWDGATADGTAIVTVGPAGRVHTCEVDAGLRVLEVLHPDA